MEVEEKSTRKNSFSSDMMSTIRDDPEKYREMLRDISKKKQQQSQTPPQTPPAQGHTPPPPVKSAEQRPTAPAAQPATGYRQGQAPPPVPPANSKRNLILGISVVVIVAIVVALLFIFKVI
jgi:hypothetical protein